MKIVRKVTSAALAFSFLIACNFCLVECAYATEEQDHSAKVSDTACHQTSGGNEKQSNSEKHEAGSECCSSLVATKNSQSDLTDTKLVKDSFSRAVIFEKYIPQRDLSAQSKIVFHPGASPPAVFLSSHFTHAPPASL